MRFASKTVLLLLPVSVFADAWLRRDGLPVQLLEPGQWEAEQAIYAMHTYPFKPFSAASVENALATPTDWRQLGAVTPAKDQGAHPFCGTFGRVATFEGQFALRAPNKELVSFSEEMLVDCIGWDKDQFTYVAKNGLMNTSDYRYDVSPHADVDPPIPGHPCKFNFSEVVPWTNYPDRSSAVSPWTGLTGSAPSESQLVAFVHRNGPVAVGIASFIFGLRAKGCEATKTCVITPGMCQDPRMKGKVIDHAVTLVGYGTTAEHADYWIVKNSWSEAFANDGFINVPRGIGCAGLTGAAGLMMYGEPSTYYEATTSPVSQINPALLKSKPLNVLV